jgi:hypothetical protein
VANMLRACGEHVAINIQTSCCEHFFHVVNNFSHVANTFSMLRPSPSSPDILYMLRACDEHVASLWRACCDHHPNIRWKVDEQLGGRPIFPPVGRLISSITVSFFYKIAVFSISFLS